MPQNERNASTQAAIDALQQEAIRRCGFDDFGPDSYMLPLSMLVEAGLSMPGRDFWNEEIVIALVGRLVREASWKANPNYRAQKITAPLVICGMPRTGTTALHKLLSVDPQFQGLDHWLTAWPKPRPPRETWSSEPGFHHAVAVLEKRFADLPAVKVSHDMVADEVDECLEVLRLDFVANNFPSMTSLPTYDQWFRQQDETPLYRRLADTMRLIGLHDKRTWLLKNPGHFGHIEQLLTVFPDARVIVTHRDPVKAMSSLCSVLENVHRMIDPDCDITQIGRRELEYWSHAQRTTAEQRATRSASQFLDVHHADFHANPIGSIRAIYDQFQLELTAPVETAMRAWLNANPAGKLGEHRYTPEHYGLTGQHIIEAFADG